MPALSIYLKDDKILTMSVSNSTEIFYDSIAKNYDRWKNKNRYYHKKLTFLYQFLIPPGQKVIEIGCSTGDLLAFVKPTKGVGVDISGEMIKIAKKKYPKMTFIKTSAEGLNLKEKFDYIILSDAIGFFEDIQLALTKLHQLSTDDSRIIINCHNYFWQPFLSFFEKIGLKSPQYLQSWLSNRDIENLLELANLDIVKQNSYLLVPFYIPLVSHFANKYLARLPFIRIFCFVKYFVVRLDPAYENKKENSVSIILPARNEEGNIETAVKEIPTLGKHMELIFVEDHSKDKTRAEIKRVQEQYKNKHAIRYFVQKDEYGKAAAVRKGFAEAKGDILIVFDSDLTTDPKDLPKFYEALRDRKAEFIQGSRLVYPMEKQAMRFLNIIGNKIFSILFTFLLDQRIKDTLCGTKLLFRKDYEKIVKNRSYFGDLDPFGDFDLIFGATKLNLKMLEIPIRYKARVYGKTNIKRFSHGWLLLQMTFVAAKKIKFF